MSNLLYSYLSSISPSIPPKGGTKNAVALTKLPVRPLVAHTGLPEYQLASSIPAQQDLAILLQRRDRLMTDKFNWFCVGTVAALLLTTFGGSSAAAQTDEQKYAGAEQQQITMPGNELKADPVADTDSENPDDKPEQEREPLITNDAVIFGILMVILAFVFWSSSSEIAAFKAFYKIIPMLLMCYFLPALLPLFGVVDPENKNLYFVATRFLLPASLVLLTLSIDLRGIINLGPKALIMFVVGTIGVVIGGPLAILLVSLFEPEWVGGVKPNEVWRGLTTVAGSWIGGGANQMAMKEIWEVGGGIFPAMIAVDVLVAEFWMIFLLLGVGKAETIDRWLKADASAIERLKNKMDLFSTKSARIATATDLMVIGAIAFGATALSHFLADTLSPMMSELAATEVRSAGPDGSSITGTPYQWVENFGLHKNFFWIVVAATTVGVALSFTPLREYEGAGASKLGTVFIFILVAVIGMKMDVAAVVKYWQLFIVGLIWMLIHVGLLVLTAWLIRAPYFFLAVGSKANIGGAASAPVVAAAFHPSLAPVGVLLAVLGYALGTYAALICGYLMKAVAP